MLVSRFNVDEEAGLDDPATFARSLREMAAELQSAACSRPEEEFIRHALDSAAIVAITDVHGTITYVNRKFCEISGYRADELVGSNHRILKSDRHGTEFFRSMYRMIARGRVWHGEICNRRKDGSHYWVDTTIVPHMSASGKPDSYTSIRFDMTKQKALEDELRSSEEHLRCLAELDPLTGLANRRHFQDRIEELTSAKAQERHRFHLALLDIDSFKDINDTLGHDAGDKLLRILASRINANQGSHGFVARLGGDEFGLVLAGVRDDEAKVFFEQILTAIRLPIQTRAFSRQCSASAGITVFPDDGLNAGDLFKAADLALYQAKSQGRDRLEFFRPELKYAVESRSRVLSEIRHGLQADAFELHYQPVVPVTRDEPVSVEALLRWRHSERGLLAPGAFLEGFADPATCAAFGKLVLEKVFEDAAVFKAGGLQLQPIAINVTSMDFQSTDFVNRIFSLSHTSGVSLEQLCVEVTEGMFLNVGHDRIERGLRRLHEAGVEIALDDFGTGHASLTHLRQLPFDRLKIDRSFVASIVDSHEDQVIISGIVDIAHALGKLVTAEGVETMEQAQLLTPNGLRPAPGLVFRQGLLSGKPAGHCGDVI